MKEYMKITVEGAKKGNFYKLTKASGTLLSVEGLGEVEISGLLLTIAETMDWMLGFCQEDNFLEVMTYASIHTHSEYSILDAMNRVEDLAAAAAGAMALTDHGNMCGCLAFQKAMLKHEKKPILGCEVYMEKPASESGRRGTYHLILLAKNQEGLKNLTKIVSLAYNNMYNGRGLVTWSLLKEFHTGLVCTSACVAGEVARKAADNDMEGAREVVRQLKELFGEDFYIEIQHHGFQQECHVNPLLIQLAEEERVKLIAGVDAHWLSKGQGESHDMLLAIHDKKNMVNPHRTFEGEDYHILSQEEAFYLFQGHTEALQSTLEVVLKCNARFETGEYHTPSFEFIPEGFDGEVDYFKHLIKKGYTEKIIRTGKHNQEYQTRLQYETKVILNMGYAAYFLIVNEYVVWAKNNGVAVGPGRGSAAGSLVAYCLDITDVDPLKYGLLFERFLNPDRVSMPDIDMDFEDSKRHLVIQHIKDLYGPERVTNIVTFGKMKARKAIRDVGRVYMQQGLASTLCGYIPKGDPKITIKKAMEQNPDFSALYQRDEQAHFLLDKAMEIEGLNRNKSSHACGVVIAPEAVSNFTPTFMVGSQKEGYNQATQFDCVEVEEVGLLKMDFLGLKTMGVLNESVNLIKEAGKPLPAGVTDYSNIPLNDPYVYRDIAKGSDAIFQIESGGMQGLMKQLYSDVSSKISAIEAKYHGKKTDSGFISEMAQFGDELFDRLIAGVAMYRPGPMDFIPDYIEGMNHPENIVYDVPELEPILSSTYGVIVYQEQVMEIVRRLAGFSMAQADMVRKAMGKKKEELMEEYREYFLYGSGNKVDSHTKQPMNIRGCVANGIGEDVANIIWNKMKDFAKYAFNKSHACAYAMLSARCAWLRYYYQTYYMAATLNVYVEDNNKFSVYLNNTRLMGIHILPPDINQSGEKFTVVEDHKILFGLKGLRGLNKSVPGIIKKRESGVYTSIPDFLYRTGVNKATLSSLIYSGAMDCFYGTRNGKISMIEKWIEDTKKKKKANKGKIESQISFDFMEKKPELAVPDLPEMEKKVLLREEKKYSGIYISEHPMDQYRYACSLYGVRTLNEIITYDEEGNVLNFVTQDIRIAGVVSELKVIRTKKDKRPMAFFNAEDTTGIIPCVFFPNAYAKYSNAVAADECVYMTGKLQEKDGEVQFIIDTVVSCENLDISSKVNTVYVRIHSKEEYLALEDVLATSTGNILARFYYEGQYYSCKSTVTPTAELFMLLEERFGRSNVQYR